MPAPVRSPEQRSAALEVAMRTRMLRAELRLALKAGVTDPQTVLAADTTNPSYAQLRVRWLLEALPGIGPIRAEQLMRNLGIAQSRRVGGLNPRQRQLLIEALVR